MEKLRRQIGNRLVWLASKWTRDTRPRVIVLHDIDDARAFYERMVWLKTNYSIMHLRQLEWKLSHSVALTFDDCFASWHEVGMPVLNALKIPATFFVCSGRVVADSRSPGPRQLSEQQVVNMASNELFTIGSHTVTHPTWSMVTGGHFYSEIYSDINRLKEIANSNINFFAYPYGQPSNITTDSMLYLMRLGIKRAFSTIPRPIGHEFVSGRLSLSVSDPTWVWDARLSGGWDWLYRRTKRR